MVIGVLCDRASGLSDALGPIFNAQSCDACHNSRRRGRGPRADGEAPAGLVIQLGRRFPDGRVQGGIEEYGHDGQAHNARERFMALSADQRRELVRWIAER